MLQHILIICLPSEWGGANVDLLITIIHFLFFRKVFQTVTVLLKEELQNISDDSTLLSFLEKAVFLLPS